MDAIKKLQFSDAEFAEIDLYAQEGSIFGKQPERALPRKRAMSGLSLCCALGSDEIAQHEPKNEMPST